MLTTAGFDFSAMSAKLGSATPRLGADGAEASDAAGFGVPCASLFDPQGNQSAKAASPRAEAAIQAATSAAAYNFAYDLRDCRTGLFKVVVSLVLAPRSVET